MGTKNNPAPNDCYARALPDEPMFVLLARDPLAPATISAWAQWRQAEVDSGLRPETDRVLVDEAVRLAFNMIKWREENHGAWRRVGDTLGAGAAGDSVRAEEEMLRPNIWVSKQTQRWRHLATGGYYREIGRATIMERTGNRLAVVYVSERDGTMHVRSESEFLDGRFERVKKPKEMRAAAP